MVIQKFFILHTVFVIIKSDNISNEALIIPGLLFIVVFKRDCKSEIDFIQVDRVIWLIKMDLVMC